MRNVRVGTRALFVVSALALAGCESDLTTPQPRLAPSSPALSAGPTLLSEDFSGPLDPARWTVVTTPPASSYTLSGGAITLYNRAHLNTTEHFPPADLGGIRVTGEWTVSGAGDDFIQILTRSDGVPVPPFYETGSGVQFYALTSHVGEAPNQMGIGAPGLGPVTSTGSLTISPGVKYLFLVEDDGLNVLFQLTRADDPSQTRTLTASTSYDPATNRVVFHNREICCGGSHAATLDNVSITQLTTPDVTPPSITPVLAAPDGANGWHVSPVTVGWLVEDAESEITSQVGCGDTLLDAETTGVILTCEATSAGGTASVDQSVQLDLTAPALAFVGNQGTYGIDATLSIACEASDGVSGVDGSTLDCAGADGPALSFGPGTHTLEASVSDFAGRQATATTQFTIVVDGGSLTELIEDLVPDPNAAATLASHVASITSAPNANAKAGKVNAFRNYVRAQSGKKIPAAAAAALLGLVGEL